MNLSLRIIFGWERPHSYDFTDNITYGTIASTASVKLEPLLTYNTRKKRCQDKRNSSHQEAGDAARSVSIMDLIKNSPALYEDLTMGPDAIYRKPYHI